MPEEFFNAVFFNEPAIFQDDTAVADLLNYGHFMGYQNDRNIILPVDILDQLKDRFGRFRIQSRCRFIAKQYLGIAGEDSGDRHSLLLTAGKLCRIGFSLVLQTDDLEIFHGLFSGFGLFDTNDLHRETDIVQDCILHKQVKRLEDHSNLSSFFAETFFIKIQEVLAIDDDSSFIRFLQQVQASYQCGFACPGKTDDAEDLALVYLEADIVQSMNDTGFGVKGLGQMRYINHRLHITQ